MNTGIRFRIIAATVFPEAVVGWRVAGIGGQVNLTPYFIDQCLLHTYTRRAEAMGVAEFFP